MAKKKKSSKDSKQTSIPTEWTGKSVEQLKDLIDELQCDLKKAKKSRNKAQTEFASIQSYYDVTRENIRELDMRIEKKDLEIENVEQDNEAELKVYEQKSNFVKYCHEQKLKQTKEDTDSRTKESIADHESQVETTKTTTEQLVNDKDATEERNDEELSNTRKQRIDDLSRIKRQLDADVLSFEQKCFAHQKQHTKELADRRTSELHAIETRKNTHLKDIMTSHERSCKDMKSYFTGVERQQSIDTEELEAQIRRLKKLVVKHESESSDVKESNRVHGDDLKLCSDAVITLKHQTKDMEKDGISLKAANARLKVTRKAILEARNEYESLQRKVAALKEEIDNCKLQTEELGCTTAASSVIRSNAAKTEVLKDKVTKQHEKNAIINQHRFHVVASAGISGEASKDLSCNMSDFVTQANKEIEKLTIKIAKAKGRYNDDVNKLQNSGRDIDTAVLEVC